jgi:Large polyvalent protein-associated domain 7/Relaxase/Mobilisation nuclease domain
MSPAGGMSWAGVTASVDRHLAGRPPAAIAFTRNPIFRPPSGGRPHSGVVPRSRNDELEMDGPGRPRSGAAAARSMPSFGRGGPSPARSVHPARPAHAGGAFGAIGVGAGGAPRSPLLAKANLANGAQAAVVKLASYGSGPTRAAALLGYQSHHGELALERQDGTMVVGAQEVADVAASWEGSQRAPSNDVLSLGMTIEGSLTRDEAQAGLQEALKGHSYAWTYRHEDEAARINVVMVAASSERDARGHLERFYANEKSIAGLRGRLEAQFGGWPNDFGEPRWGHGIEGAATALARMTRAGEVEAYMPDGRPLRDEASAIWEGRPSAVGRHVPDDLNPSLEIAKSWESEMRSRSPRDFAHIILSAKAGTDKEDFMDAARATLAKEFAGHEYVFVMHTNRDHIHVHAAVRLERSDGERLDPKIQHFSQWRDTLAHEARERNIPMENLRRFDQAHAPAYKLKDVKMMERGNAPESVRNRVERVNDREIFRPSRPEGVQRAEEAAREWRAVSAERARSDLPPPADGALRLYRFERGDEPHRGALFSSDRSVAEAYARPGEGGRLVYVDVPADRVGELTRARSEPDHLFAVPRAIAATAKPAETDAAVLPFRARVEAAIGNPERSTPPSEMKPMRTVETMTEARAGMAEVLAKIEAILPEDRLPEFSDDSRKLLEAADRAIAAQARLDSQKADVQGDRYVKPEPAKDLADIITHQRRGDEIHYSRHDGTGAYQTIAFVDRGKEIDVRDWNNSASINAALTLASQKWETLTINGSDEYKERAAQLAAEHGYKIANPELQERISELRRMRTEAASEREAPRPADDRSPLGESRAAKTDEAGSPSGPARTPAEREITLGVVRERIEGEADRENRQAGRAEHAHERNPAEGSAATPYRSQEQAEAARELRRAMENDPYLPAPTDPRQSEEMAKLSDQQRRLLDEQEEQRRRDVENAERVNREYEQSRRRESEGESE